MEFLKVRFEGKQRAFWSIADMVQRLGLDYLAEEVRQELERSMVAGKTTYAAINPLARRKEERTLIIAPTRKVLREKVYGLVAPSEIIVDADAGPHNGQLQDAAPPRPQPA